VIEATDGKNSAIIPLMEPLIGIKAFFCERRTPTTSNVWSNINNIIYIAVCI
jgi:hypothetical protein